VSYRDASHGIVSCREASHGTVCHIATLLAAQCVISRRFSQHSVSSINVLLIREGEKETYLPVMRTKASEGVIHVNTCSSVHAGTTSAVIKP